MKGLAKIIDKHLERIALFIVILFGILAARSLIFQSGYFNMHDDLQLMRQLELEKCFLDGQIPCRWVPDMGYGFGFPLFNFYPPLPYLIGEIFRVVGFSFVNTAKLTFALSFIASGITMYYLAKEFFGRLGAVLSSVFYIWAPYHAVDVYVRGAMNEAWAMVWFPLIFWAGYRLIKAKKKEVSKWIIVLALSYFALFTSHNLMVLIFTPFFGLWLLLHLWREKAWSRLPQLTFSGIFAFLLAAFFTLPVLVEKKYVQVDTLVVGYYDYVAHFASLPQLLFSRFWGYGPSVWDTADGMSFQIGHLHWIGSLLTALFVGIRYLKKRTFETIDYIAILLFGMGWLSLFMAHSRSTPIWNLIGPLQFVQFPWRFLTTATFAFAFLIGYIPGLMEKVDKGALSKFIAKYFELSLVALWTIALVIFNWNYFRPEKMGPLTDKEKFSGAAWELQQTAGIYDYLPNASKEAPKGPRRNLAEITEGEGVISDEEQGTDWARFTADVGTSEATVRIGIFKFPGFTVTADGEEKETFVPEDERWGRMYVTLEKGTHDVRVELQNTPVRTAGNLISLVAWVGLFAYPLWRKRK